MSARKLCETCALATPSLPVTMDRHVVSLPEVEFITCSDLAHHIADAMDRWHPGARRAPTSRRFTLSDATEYSAMPEPQRQQNTSAFLQEYRGAPFSPHWDPSMASSEERDPHLAHWLRAVTMRLRDLQTWVDKGELAIFDSNRLNCRVVAPGTYVKRADAVRYCKASGLEIKTADQRSESSLEASKAESTCTRSARPANLVNFVEPSTSQGLPGPSNTLPAAQAPSPIGSLLRPKQVIAKTGLSRSMFYERQKPDSKYFDPSFPRSRVLGNGSVAFLETEIDRWISERPKTRLRT